ncbi:hypothetical protein M9H77_07899 [Catharanthus roseus]|uniref:Uncharacterized protein n=1 Tax=Catharanthus roseus TaxID=4058 RepID=A0ACC0BWJ5_CATRO|nr:hypothetical protein M9H77_07899 [Catharanthus roseus]
MEYDWSNLPWKKMEGKRKQEDYQSKLARAKHNLHHGGGNGFNAYGGVNHGNGNFTPRKHVGVDNYSSYASSFEHTSYDEYGGYGRCSKEKESELEKSEKEFLLNDFENQMGVNLELFKVNPLAFEKSNLRKEGFEQEFFDKMVLKGKVDHRGIIHWKGELVSLLYCKEELGGLSPSGEMEH